MHSWVVVSIFLYFQPYLGKIPILTNIFQMGWNHQLDNMELIPCHYENPVFLKMSQFLIRKNGWSMSPVAIGSDETTMTRSMGPWSRSKGHFLVRASLPPTVMNSVDNVAILEHF